MRLTSRLAGNLYENGAYLGLPLAILAAVFLWRHRREPRARLIAIMLAVIMIASLGPILHVNGRAVAMLPWALAEKLPLIRYALPVRFAVYAFLIMGMLMSLFLADPTRAGGGVLVIWVFAALLPNPLLLLHASRYEEPAFFTRGIYRTFLKRGANVLVVPFGISGPSMLWQADTAMYFNMTGAYTGLTPPEFQKWPLLRTLANSIPVPQQDEQLKAFLRAYSIDAVVVADGAGGAARRLAEAVDPDPVQVGGVSLYRVPRGLTASSAPSSALRRFQRIAADAWFDQLLCAAGDFLRGGHSPSELNPAQAQRLGLLPVSQWSDRLDVLIAGFGNASNNGLWVGGGPHGTIAIGLPASGAAAGAIAERYGADAAALFFPYPARYASVPDDGGVHFLLALMRPAAVGYCRLDPSNRLNLPRQHGGS
jgi:energy-coupling factor transporter transmembrane protein EcfT